MESVNRNSNTKQKTNIGKPMRVSADADSRKKRKYRPDISTGRCIGLSLILFILHYT